MHQFWLASLCETQHKRENRVAGADQREAPASVSATCSARSRCDVGFCAPVVRRIVPYSARHLPGLRFAGARWSPGHTRLLCVAAPAFTVGGAAIRERGFVPVTRRIYNN